MSKSVTPKANILCPFQERSYLSQSKRVFEPSDNAR
jgi:hypothetical protein